MQTQRRQMRPLSGQATVEDRSGKWLNARCCRVHGNKSIVSRMETSVLAYLMVVPMLTAVLVYVVVTCMVASIHE